MLTRTLTRALFETKSQLPPTFLLPWIATITTTSKEPCTPQPPATSRRAQPLTNSTTVRARGTGMNARRLTTVTNTSASQLELPPPGSTTSTLLSDSVRELLPLMRGQSAHYAILHIHGKPYLVTQGDTVRLPFYMHGVEPGDVLRLNRAVNVGSRDYTLKAPAPAPSLKSPTTMSTTTLDPTSGKHSTNSRVMPTGATSGSLSSLPVPHFVPHIGKGKHSYVDDRLFVCRAVVMGVESEPMRIKEKTKRRQRHIRKVKSKHRFTILRIKELRVKTVEEVETIEE